MAKSKTTEHNKAHDKVHDKVHGEVHGEDDVTQRRQIGHDQH